MVHAACPEIASCAYVLLVLPAPATTMYVGTAVLPVPALIAPVVLMIANELTVVPVVVSFRTSVTDAQPCRLRLIAFIPSEPPHWGALADVGPTNSGTPGSIGLGSERHDSSFVVDPPPGVGPAYTIPPACVLVLMQGQIPRTLAAL
jgi:hypothetical protein